jgi:hypothetical protein
MNIKILRRRLDPSAVLPCIRAARRDQESGDRRASHE